MSAFSDLVENRLIDGLFRGGAMNSSGTLNSASVVKGIWTATTSYSVGDIVNPASGAVSAGGKFLLCTTAGTSAGTFTSTLGNPGTTVTDNTVTWTVISGVPTFGKLYAALLNINKGLRANTTAYSVGDCISLTANDTKQHVYRCTTAGTTAAAQSTLYPGVPGEVITDNTAVFTELQPVLDSGTGFPAGLVEVSGGSYARIAINAGTLMALTDLNGSNGTTAASTGTNGTLNNANAITFSPGPTANWTTSPQAIGVVAIYDQLTAGNLLFAGALTVPKSVNNADPAPSFTATSLSLQVDN
jgi:hypothetical protein